MTIEDIMIENGLQTQFLPFPCDFCAGILEDRTNKLCYTDPETKWRFCLDCLEIALEGVCLEEKGVCLSAVCLEETCPVVSTEGWPETEWPELPPDPGVMEMAREVIYAPRD